MGWESGSFIVVAKRSRVCSAQRPHCLGMPTGQLEKEAKFRKVAGGAACFALAGGAACSQHLDVLKYDPAMRPAASRLTCDWKHVPEKIERLAI